MLVNINAVTKIFLIPKVMSLIRSDYHSLVVYILDAG